MMNLSLDAARTLHLAAQGLASSPRRRATKRDVRDAIRRMGALQIDTISVVARSHNFVLWSRLGDYNPRWLDELLAEGALFEYWAHAASFIPIEDYGLYRHRMDDHHFVRHSRAWLDKHPDAAERVLDLMRAKGFVRASNFPRTDGRKGAWWDHKPEKIALECLLDVGDLMIARREQFQRVYSLREQVLPNWNGDAALSTEQARRALIEKSIRALGVAPVRWIPDYFRLSKHGGITSQRRSQGISAIVAELVDAGKVFEVSVEDWSEPAYVHTDLRALAKKISSGALQPSHTTLLSPFDPVVWDRARAQELFGFNYRIEVYTPSARRKFGYFTLPILHNGRLVGRLDPKAHRQQGVFEVKAIHLERGVAVTEELVQALTSTLRTCAAWHNTPKVIVQQTEPRKLSGALRAALKN